MGQIILPEATIGIIGGGQLGKMLSNAAQALGYKVIIWSEEEDCPACRVATSTIIGRYTDGEKRKQFINQVDVVTVETEHIPLSTLEAIVEEVPIYPDPNIVGIAQNRRKEKSWLAQKELPVVPFQIVTSIDEIQAFKQEINDDIVIKTITGGYDGKGQLRISNKEISHQEIEQINNWLDKNEVLIAEAWIPVKAELSVIAARNNNKKFSAFPAVENEHRNHILHQTIAPARIDTRLEKEAINITEKIMDLMDYVGLLCVEFFYDSNGQLYINELAPRPHNSGHYTLDAAVTSQFEQTIRAICGLPLGSTTLLAPSVMTNLLGDLWNNELKIETILNEPNMKLHLYGKKEARQKRKMGHYTTLADTIEKAIEQAESIYCLL